MKQIAKPAPEINKARLQSFHAGDALAAALMQFGKPNLQLSRGSQMRFGRKGSVAVDLEAGIYFNHETGEGGRLTGLPQRSAPYARATAKERDYGDDERRARQIRDLWAGTQPLTGTPAERYLKGRRIDCTPPDDLRFHPACPRERERAPAMVAAIRDISENWIIGVHRTFLKADGSGRDGEKMILGRARGGVIKLSDDADVTTGLGLSEGIETGLSLLSIGWRPIWAAISAGGITKFPVLSGVESLTLFADHDDAGERASKECARRWIEAGREARIARPRKAGKDWNDV